MMRVDAMTLDEGPPDTPQRRAAIEPPLPGRQIGAVAIVAVLSAVAAFGVDAVQGRPLGDEPFVMLVFGGMLAVVAGAMRWAPPILVGPAAMAGFPICAAVDMARNGGHNLFPFEFAFYAVYAGIGFFVAAVARHCRS